MDLSIFDPYIPRTSEERWLMEQIFAARVFEPTASAPLPLLNDETYEGSVRTLSEHGGWDEHGIFTAYVVVERKQFDFASMLDVYYIPIRLCLSPTISGERWIGAKLYWQIMPSAWTPEEQGGLWQNVQPRLSLPPAEERDQVLS